VPEKHRALFKDKTVFIERVTPAPKEPVPPVPVPVPNPKSGG
jgi:hypothetical protein